MKQCLDIKILSTLTLWVFGFSGFHKNPRHTHAEAAIPGAKSPSNQINSPMGSITQKKTPT